MDDQPIFSTGAAQAFVQAELANNDELARYFQLLERGVFVDDEGREERIGAEGVDFKVATVVYYLVRKLGATHTLETGFGTGMSALAFLLAKHDMGDQRHLAIDPFGLPDRRGELAANYLTRRFGGRFQRLREPSEFALPALARSWDGATLRLMLIDGDHRFDGVFVDFFYLDRLCPVGGCILLDDFKFPAIETVMSFVATNKTNYRIHEMRRVAVLEKVEESDLRTWDHFRTFRVPKRPDWTPRREEPRFADETESPTSEPRS